MSRFAPVVTLFVFLVISPGPLAGQDDDSARQTRDPALPPGVAESLSGAELWRWRARLHEAVALSQQDLAVAVLERLLGDDPAAHFCRSSIALEATRLRSRDVDSRRLFASLLLELDLPDRPPLDRARFDEWVTRRHPFVDPALVLQSANRCLQRGRVEDAARWYGLALEVTPATESPFFEIVHGLLQIALRADARSPWIQAELEELTGRPWPLLEEGLWLEERLAVLAGYHPPSEVDRCCRELLQRCPGSRFVVALLDRVDAASDLLPEDRGVQPEESCEKLMQLAEDPLDRAAILQRYANVLLLRDATRERGFDALRRALELAPPSTRAQSIHGDLLIQLARSPEHDDELVEALAAALRRHPFYWEGLVPAVDVALLELAEYGRTAALTTACELVLAHVPADHPFRARALLELARTTTDAGERQRRLEECIAVPRVAVRFLDPPQLEALRELSTLLERRDEYARAADALARALALAPPPEPFDAQGFQDLARWLELRLRAGETVSACFDDVVAIVADGNGVGRSQEDRILSALLAPLRERASSFELQQRIARYRDDRVSRGMTPEAFQFWSRVEELVCIDPALLARVERTFSSDGDVSDAQVYALTAEALEHEQASLALRVLARALERDPDEGERFSTPPPADLLRAVRARGGLLEQEWEWEAACAFLAPHADLETRAWLFEALAAPQDFARAAAAEALHQQVPTQREPLTPRERECAEVLYRALEDGEWRWLPLCVTLDRVRCAEAVVRWFETPNSRVQRLGVLRRLAQIDATAAMQTLEALVSRTEEDAALEAIEMLQRMGRELEAEQRWRVARLAAGQHPALRAPALAAVGSEALTLPRTDAPFLLGFLADPSPEVQQAARQCLLRVQGTDAYRGLLDGLLETPRLLDQPFVHKTLERLAPGPLPDLSAPGERVARLRELRDAAGG